MAEAIKYLTLYLGEWPYIFTIGLAVYLSFEYWAFPDLTIESSFTAGMVSTFLAFKWGSPHPLLWLFLFVSIPLLFSLITWSLARLNMPPLFAGLLVLLAAYTVNLKLNGSDIIQSGFINDASELPFFLRPGFLHLNLNAVEKGYLISLLIIAPLVSLSLWLFAYSTWALKVNLSRRVVDTVVATAMGINPNLALLLCMCIYNTIAYSGGVGFALGSDMSGVTFLGSITPGLTCMFILKGIKELFSSPKRKNYGRKETRKKTSLSLDSVPVIILLLAFVSLGVTFIRFFIRGWVRGEVGLLNAYTAIGTVAFWFLISGFAYLIGRRVSYGKVKHQ